MTTNQQVYEDDSRLNQQYFDDNLKLTSDVAWYHPIEDAIYVSKNDKMPQFREGHKVIPSVRFAKEQAMLKRQGKLDEDKATFSIYNRKDGWEDKALEYFDFKARTANIMTPQAYSGIEVTNVLTNVLFGVMEKDYVLQNAVRVINTPYIDLKLDTWTGWDVKTDIPIGAEIPSDQGAYTRQTVTLKMDGAHIARYDELDMRPYYRDIWRDNLENIGRRMVKAKAQKVATELETSTGIATADWSAFTTDHNTTNPATAIVGAAQAIIANDGRPSKTALDPLVLAEYLTNTNINSPIQGTQRLGATAELNELTSGAAFQTTLPKVGLTAFVDSLMTDTVLVIWDDEAVILGQGPTGTARYRDEHHRAEGYYAKDYNVVKIVQSGKIRKLTGI